MVLVEFILIRHGYSCSNAAKAIKPEDPNKKYKMYPDPELTTVGILHCSHRHMDTIRAIKQKFGESYKIGTSSLIRAQQSAYYTLLETDSEAKYSIFPHIAEAGECIENTPEPREKQVKRLDPDAASRLAWDAREETDHSNWGKFWAWLQGLSAADASNYFHITSTGVYQAVIFTHGHMIRQLLSIEQVNNNEIFFAKINTERPNTPYVEKLKEYPAISEKSMIGCYISFDSLPPFVGGSRKQRAKKQNRKARTRKRKSKYSLQTRRV